MGQELEFISGTGSVGREGVKHEFASGKPEPHLRLYVVQLKLVIFCFLTLFSLSILILIKSD